MDIMVWMPVAGSLLAAGAAWGGTRVALNGTRQRVKDLEDGFKEHRQEFHLHKLDTARMETKLDMLLTSRD